MSRSAVVQDAVQMVTTSREAIPAAADRRAAAVAAARHAIEAAVAAERAEQDAARSALRAGLGRLAAAGLDSRDIAGLCGFVPAVDAPESDGPDSTTSSPGGGEQPAGRPATPCAPCRLPEPTSGAHRTRRRPRSPSLRAAAPPAVAGAAGSPRRTLTIGEAGTTSG